LIRNPLVVLKLPTVGLVSLLIACSAHIRPNPQYSWPDMASSKISGKLAVYIPREKLASVVKSESTPGRLKHKPLAIGAGAKIMTQQAVTAVFDNADYFDKIPDEKNLKNLGYRGLLVLDSINILLNMPAVDSLVGDSLNISDMSIRVGIVYTAHDYLIQLAEPVKFGPDGQVGKRMHRADLKKIDIVLKDITDRILKENADYLAKSLIQIYGARQ